MCLCESSECVQANTGSCEKKFEFCCVVIIIIIIKNKKIKVVKNSCGLLYLCIECVIILCGILDK